MEEREDRWDEYIEGALFTINSNVSTTTKHSPFFLMFGRKPRLPFEVEKNEQELQDSDVVPLIEALSSEERILEHVNDMSNIRDALFPVVDANIKAAQKKQQEQYIKKRGHPVCPFKVGDQVLQRNMIQKTKKGHKFEDQWLGPYRITELNAEKGTCRLSKEAGKNLVKVVSIKHIKRYLMPCQSDSGIADSSLSSVKDNNVQSAADKDPSPSVIKPESKRPVPTTDKTCCTPVERRPGKTSTTSALKPSAKKSASNGDREVNTSYQPSWRSVL